jgi:hypothetical protein
MRLYAENNENQNPETATEKRQLTTGEKILVGTLVAGAVGASVYCVHLGVHAVCDDAVAVGRGAKAGYIKAKESIENKKQKKENKAAALKVLMANGMTEEEAKAVLG